MGKRRRGRKITGKDPKSTLPKISPFQKALEPGSQDDLRAPRAREDDLFDDVNDDDGHSSSSSQPSWKKGGSRGEEGCRQARPTEVCDPTDPGFYGHRHRDPVALAEHLGHLGHDWGPGLIRRYGLHAVEAALRDLEDATELIRSDAAFITAQTKRHHMDPHSNASRAQREEYARQRREAQGQRDSQECSVPTVSGDPDPVAVELWDSAIDRLLPRLQTPMARTTLERTRGHALFNDALFVTVEDSYVAGYLNRSLYLLIEEAVTLERGRETEVTFAVADPESGPTPEASEDLAPAVIDHASAHEWGQAETFNSPVDVPTTREESPRRLRPVLKPGRS